MFITSQKARIVLSVLFLLSFAPILVGNALSTGPVWSPISSVNAPQPRRSFSSIWTGNKMLIWGGNGTAGTCATNTGGLYDPVADTWTPTSLGNVPTARRHHATVWTGIEMIVWGGEYCNGPPPPTDGGRYNPATHTWTPISTVNAPSTRYVPGAVWTGTEMIVWGGDTSNSAFQTLNTGGRYNLSTNTWTSMSTIGAPSPRAGERAMFWTGSEVIVWGGGRGATVPNGARYNPVTDTWNPMNPGNLDAGFIGYAGIWTGSELIVWGGQNRFGNFVNTGQRYNPVADTWTPISNVGAPSGRIATPVWTGSEMFVWGGFDVTGDLNSGGIYNPSTDEWRSITLTGAPSLRTEVFPVWTGNEVIVWGGFHYDGTEHVYNDGAKFTPNSACTSWNLTSEFRVSPNQANPNPDNCGNTNVWHYLEGSGHHNPATYSLLPEFLTDSHQVEGLQGWQDATNTVIFSNTKVPYIVKNTTGTGQYIISASWPAGAVVIHPWFTKFPVIGWRSPVNSLVDVTGRFSDIDPNGGDGVDWYIDHESANLAQGSLVSNTQDFQLSNISVSEGDYLYFAVTPRGNPGYDSTCLDINITTDGFAGASISTCPPPTNHPPTVNAGGPYEVNEGGAVQVTAIGSDPESSQLAYAWDLDNNGSFETPGQSATFSAVELVGPSTRTIAVQVTDNGGLKATDTATVNVLSVLRIITESPLPSGTVGVPYSVLLEAEGGTQPYTWSIVGGTLPPGLNINATTGEISGTSTTAGTFGFTVQVQDSAQLVVSKQFSLAPPPSSGNAGSTYVLPISIPTVPPDSPPSGGEPPACSNYRLVSGTLPDGVTMDPVTGIISGIPLDGGTYNFIVECVDSTNQTASKAFTITIYNPLPTITQLVPSQVRANTGDFTLKVIGTDFVQSSIVRWNGSDRLTTFISTTELEAAILNNDIATPGTASVTVVNPEPNGGTSNAVAFTILSNDPPEVDSGGPYSGDEGSLILLSNASASDSDGDNLTFSWSVNSTLCSFSSPNVLNPNITCKDNGNYTSTLTVNDGINDPVSSEAVVIVDNVAPTVGTIIVPLSPVRINTAINASVAFTDPGMLDTHTAVWDWEGSTSAGTVSESNGSGSVTGSHTYTSAGVYTVKVTVTDDDGDSGQSTFQYVVVYDPSGGFVTGGGWINSPSGAYTSDPSLTGRANFGFVSKYQRGATVPTGQTEFQFHIANLNFQSTVYDWLVISGAKAQYKGTGTINGAGNYGFLLTVTDGSPDKFRIKIWDKETDAIVYDNMLGVADTTNPTTAIGGGSIVVHR